MNLAQSVPDTTVQRVWCITDLGPTGEPGLVVSAERVTGLSSGGFLPPIWSRLGPIWDGTR